MTNKVLVGIPCYAGADDLLPECLKAIAERTNTTISYQIAVIDDSGRPEHQAKTKALCEQYNARWLMNEKNSGITSCWNSLVRSGDEPYVMLLNDDIIVTQGWLDAAIFFLENNSFCGSVGLGFYFITAADVPQLISSPTATVTPRHWSTKEYLPEEEYINDLKNITVPGRVMCAPGCSFGFTREKYNLVGGFDPAAKQFYNESWFGTALAAEGFPSYVINWPKLWHVWSATFQRSPELMVDNPMDKDRKAYIARWGGDFNYTDPKFMTQIPRQNVKWLTRDGVKEGQ